MKDLKKTFYLGLGLCVKLLTGLIAVKLCAQLLGPEAFGVTGQLSSLLSVVSLLAGAGVSVGVTKVYAGSEFHIDSRGEWIKAAKWIVLLSTGLLSALLLLASWWIAEHLFRGAAQAWWLIGGLVLAAFPLAYAAIGQGKINGSHRDDLYSISLATGSLLGLVGLWIGGIYLGPAGALLGMIWLPVAQAIVMSLFALRLDKPATSVEMSMASLKTKTRFLLGYGALSIATGVIMPVVYIIIRLLIQKHGGNEIFGLWQATLRISEAYCQLPLLLLSVVYFSRFAGSASLTLNFQKTVRTYFFIILLMGCIASLVYLTRALWIGIVFTSAFQPMENFVPWQLAGDSLRIISYIGTTILAARGKVKICVFAEILQGALLLLLSALLIPSYSNYGIYYAYIASYSLYLLFTASILVWHARPSTLSRQV